MKELLKKIPWWCWVLLPVAIVLLIVLFFRRGGGPGLPWETPSDPVERPGSAAPIVTPEQGEEIKKEVHQEAEEKREEIEKEKDEIKEQVDDWNERLK